MCPVGLECKITGDIRIDVRIQKMELKNLDFPKKSGQLKRRVSLEFPINI